MKHRIDTVIFIVIALTIVVVIAIVTKVGAQPVMEVAELALVIGWQASARMAEHINQGILDLGQQMITRLSVV